MVDKEALVEALVPFGNVVFCDSKDELFFIVVMGDWISDLITFEDIANYYIVPFFPYFGNLSLENGILKSQYNLIEPIIPIED